MPDKAHHHRFFSYICHYLRFKNWIDKVLIICCHVPHRLAESSLTDRPSFFAPRHIFWIRPVLAFQVRAERQIRQRFMISRPRRRNSLSEIVKQFTAGKLSCA
jgi:hypothetical protein